MAYLEGGSIRGSALASDSGPVEEGAANPSAPTDDQRFMMPGWQLVFAGWSRRWSRGGVCSVVSTERQVAAYGRAWLVTVGQLGDIWRQENAGVGVAPELVADAVNRRVGCQADRGSYRLLEPVGELNGVAAMTITGSREVLTRLNSPDPAYETIVSAGLAETWGLSGDEIADYLAGCPGFARSDDSST